MRKSKRDARAARTYEQFRAVLRKTTMRKKSSTSRDLSAM